MRALLLVLVSALVVGGTACGNSGGNAAGGSGAALKDLHDPKTAATATLPAQLPTPLAANASPGAGGGSASSPDTVVVKAGDTLGAIAAQVGVSADDIARANNITDPAKIQVGQQLRIPRGTPTPAAGGGAGLSAPGPGATVAVGTTVPPTGGAPSGVGTIPAGSPGPGAGPAAAASSRAGTAAAGQGSEYTVKANDTGCTIARAHDISVAELAAANGLTTAQLARLSINQILKIPPPTGHRDC